jgi:hypothetical protein
MLTIFSPAAVVDLRIQLISIASFSVLAMLVKKPTMAGAILMLKVSVQKPEI